MCSNRMRSLHLFSTHNRPQWPSLLNKTGPVVGTLLFLLLLRITAATITGYDCSNPSNAAQHFSLVDESPVCPTIYYRFNFVPTKLLFAKIPQTMIVTVFKCQITLTYNICPCDAPICLTHTEPLPVSKRECLALKANGTYHFAQFNATVALPREPFRRLNVSKVVDRFGANGTDACRGTDKTLGTAHHRGVFGNVTANISLAYAHVERDTGNLRFFVADGLKCIAENEYCIDLNGSIYVWDASGESCNFAEYEIVYHGDGDKAYRNQTGKTIYYFKDSVGQEYEVDVDAKRLLCGHYVRFSAYRRYFVTEDPDLVERLTRSVQVDHRYDTLAFKMNPVSMFSLGLPINGVFNKFAQTMACTLDQVRLSNRLTVTKNDPDLFALSYLKRPGFYSVARGEAVTLIECEPREVEYRPSDRCYQELPVTWNGKPYFVAPRTRVLQESASEIPCSLYLPPMYRVRDAWYSVAPTLDAVKGEGPASLTPSDAEYTSRPINYADTQVFGEDEILHLNRSVMARIVRASILNAIALKLLGEEPEIDVSYARFYSAIASTRSVLERAGDYARGAGNVFSAVFVVNFVAYCFYRCVLAYKERTRGGSKNKRRRSAPRK